ncbi:hypothetical protein [Permianibacter aggregans]|uniref:PLAT domain-containing protein n=1 Tax=Permianibacter aggregans TaxID=1510150 RepID=A0A4R6UD67_9GAMM|nr:hypothetical protein [Permianibacter aggregans]QGX39039.1 hypothetical protein E2H98_04935 [Permianibacter aggregans]TDQ44621.1 hypothetical protein EV696_12323 [Permianibacter aggregans]
MGKAWWSALWMLMVTATASAGLEPVAQQQVRETENFNVTIELGGDDIRGGGQLLLVFKLRVGQTRKFDLNRSREAWPGGHRKQMDITVSPAIRYGDVIEWGLEWHGAQGDLIQEQYDTDIRRVHVIRYGDRTDEAGFRLENDQTRWMGGINTQVEVNALCARDSDCHDGRYCDGPERCAPSNASADVRGCLGGISPCRCGELCNERAKRCEMPRRS